MNEHFDYPTSTLPRSRQEADTVAEDKADLAAADGKWAATAQPGLNEAQHEHLATIATESQEKIDAEFYHIFVK